MQNSHLKGQPKLLIAAVKCELVETIENDLGLDADDDAALKAALTKQGVSDILTVSTSA